MPCYNPTPAWRFYESSNDKGTRPLLFKEPNRPPETYYSSPANCRKCDFCRLKYSSEWAMRAMHEASCHEKNCFLTLTYNDRHLPSDRSVNVAELQGFMKRYRKKFGNGIRFLESGEYGEKLGRPHYHLCIFNHNFDDLPREPVKINKLGQILYSSPILEEIWQGRGFCTIGTLTHESCAYVARYVMKKVYGDDALSHYKTIDPDTGEVFKLRPEFINASRNPGLGKEWWDKFYKDVYPHDYVVNSKGFKMRPPRYYDNLYQFEQPEDFLDIKEKRELLAKQLADGVDSERLKVMAECKAHAVKKLIRVYENNL